MVVRISTKKPDGLVATMKTTTRLFVIAIFMTNTFFVLSGFACSLDEWGSATTGATVGGPGSNIARVGGKCALKVTGTGHVVDNHPVDETTFIGRFYFYPKMLGVGSYEILVAYADETDTGSDVFVVSYDGTNIKLDASAAGGGSASVKADPSSRGTWSSSPGTVANRDSCG